MDVRITRLFAVAALAATVAACGAEHQGVTAVESNDTEVSDTTDTGDTAAAIPTATAAPTTSAGEAWTAPAFREEITGAADVRVVLARFGFRSDWPLPEGLALSDVAGIGRTQSAGSDYVVTTTTLAWSAPATDDPAALSAKWYDTARAVLGVEASLLPGTFTNGIDESFDNSGGSDDDPNGALSVNVIRAAGDAASPVVIEVVFELRSAGLATQLQLDPALLAALPDLNGCIPEIVSAEYRMYSTPTGPLDPPAYTTVFDANCPTRGSYDGARVWAATAGGSISETDDSVQVRSAPGPNGTTIAVYSYLADDGTSTLRTATTATITPD